MKLTREQALAEARHDATLAFAEAMHTIRQSGLEPTETLLMAMMLPLREKYIKKLELEDSQEGN